MAKTSPELQLKPQGALFEMCYLWGCEKQSAVSILFPSSSSGGEKNPEYVLCLWTVNNYDRYFISKKTD